MTGSQIVEAVHRITAMRDRAERRQALERIEAGPFRDLVRYQCECTFKLAACWVAKIEAGMPWHKVPEGMRRMLVHMGYYKEV